MEWSIVQNGLGNKRKKGVTMYIVPSGLFKAMKKDVKKILFDSKNIITQNISDIFVDYYTWTCVNMEQMP
jgi:hypothetical protein